MAIWWFISAKTIAPNTTWDVLFIDAFSLFSYTCAGGEYNLETFNTANKHFFATTFVEMMKFKKVKSHAINSKCSKTMEISSFGKWFSIKLKLQSTKKRVLSCEESWRGVFNEANQFPNHKLNSLSDLPFPKCTTIQVRHRLSRLLCGKHVFAVPVSHIFYPPKIRTYSASSDIIKQGE